MKTLLAFDSPLYLRRLARELNGRSAGFYHDGERWTRAEFSQGVLRIWRVESYGPGDRTNYASKSFGDVSTAVFGDGNGGTICASRQPAS